MFTGIIEQQGKVQNKTEDRLFVESANKFVKELSLGASVAVNGVCLTVSEISAKMVFAADVMPETLRKTTLGRLRQGSPVNLELPLRADGRLGGHIVQGHVDGTARLVRVREKGNSRILSFSARKDILRCVVEKGSIIINGVALTVIVSAGKKCTVGIIPRTWEQTTFKSLSKGDFVNIEADILAKYALQHLKKYEK